jgi:hypothetical protein
LARGKTILEVEIEIHFQNQSLVLEARFQAGLAANASPAIA